MPANEYLNVEGRKLSKSRRWMIVMADVLDRYDPDPWRYALAASIPETQDVNFTWEEFVRRNNDELVATWGNLANRVLGFAYKRFDGRVPQPGALDADDQALLAQVAPAFERVTALLEAVKLKQALGEAMALAHEANRYLNLKEPWQQIKTDPAAAATSHLRGAAGDRQAEDAVRAVPALHLPAPARVPGLRRTSCSASCTPRRSAESSRSHLALRYDGATAAGRWAPSELQPGQPLRQPGPLFTKLEPAWPSRKSSACRPAPSECGVEAPSCPQLSTE